MNRQITSVHLFKTHTDALKTLGPPPKGGGSFLHLEDAITFLSNQCNRVTLKSFCKHIPSFWLNTEIWKSMCLKKVNSLRFPVRADYIFTRSIKRSCAPFFERRLSPILHTHRRSILLCACWSSLFRRFRFCRIGRCVVFLQLFTLILNCTACEFIANMA